MYKASIITLFLLCLLSNIALYRIARYLCLKCQILAFVPLLNLVYFSYASDSLVVETHDAEYSYLRYIVLAFMLVALVGFCLLQMEPYDITVISGRILLLSGCIFTLLTLCAGYVNILIAGFTHPILVALISLVIPFPVFLFIASFTMKSYVEESLQLYSEH